MKNIFIYLSMGLLVALISCGKPGNSLPEDILDEEKFALLLADIRMAEANKKIDHQRGIRNSKALDTAYAVIYKIHQVNALQVDKTFEYYTNNPKQFALVSEKALTILNKKKLENIKKN